MQTGRPYIFNRGIIPQQLYDTLENEHTQFLPRLLSHAIERYDLLDSVASRSH